jgi:carbonic anhydrase/acetyltransferase-like protein (isoleucine patch superfamily)
MRTVCTSLSFVVLALAAGCAERAAASHDAAFVPEEPPHISGNVKTSFSPETHTPALEPTDFVHPLASVIGAVELGADVFVAPGASIRGDEGQPIHVGKGSNVQDGVVIHALETYDHGHVIDANLVTVKGRRYAVFVGNDVSIAHQAQVHGPAYVGDNTFVGMQALVFRAHIGENCVLEPRALVMGVRVPPGRYVPAGQVVRTQEEADALPRIDERYAFAHINEGVLHVNQELAEGYAKAHHHHHGPRRR